MKIVLIQPWFDTSLFVPPLGLGYISSFLKKYNQEVYIIDGVRDNLSCYNTLDKVKEINPDVVGISCLSPYFKNAKELATLIKKEGFTIVMGGVHPTFMPYSTLIETQADFVICGEGELAWKELALSNFKNPTAIQGVYDKYSFKSEPENHLFAQIIENLDDLPFPDWEELKLNLYKHAPMGQIAKKFPIAPIMTSRGCIYGCTFCASPNFYQRKIRYRSAENVISEIKFLKQNYGIKEWQTLDDNLIYDKDFAYKLCNLLISEKINLPWTCQNGLRADKLDEEIAELMYKSGCYMVAIGVESSNPQILKNIRKGETIEQISNAIKVAHNAGMEVQGNFILGLPGETKETMEETIKYTKSSKVKRANINILQLFPGSQLYKDLKGQFDIEYEDAAANKPAYHNENVSKEDIEKALQKAVREFWLRPKIFFNTLKYIKYDQISLVLKRLIQYNFFGMKFKKIRRKTKP